MVGAKFLVAIVLSLVGFVVVLVGFVWFRCARLIYDITDRTRSSRASRSDPLRRESMKLLNVPFFLGGGVGDGLAGVGGALAWDLAAALVFSA